jgi:hypothetical protein
MLCLVLKKSLIQRLMVMLEQYAIATAQENALSSLLY